MKTLTQAAREYQARKSTAKTIIYSADRFARLCGDLPLDQIDSAKVLEYRDLCAASGLKAWTIKSSSKDIVTLLRDVGITVKVPPVKVPKPKPTPTPQDHIDSIWPYLPDYARQFVVLAYWTGLRLEDVIRLQAQPLCDDRLEFTAHKTGHFQRWPVPEWLRPWLVNMQTPYTSCMDWSEVKIRTDLATASDAAGVPVVKPSYIRDRSITEWTRADPTVGKIVHGSGLGVLDHYVDPLDVIASVMHKLKLPVCFGANTTRDAEIAEIVRRLDPQAQTMIRDMASRMVR